MRVLFLVLFFISSIVPCANSKELFEIKRGVNISHWLSQRYDKCPPIEQGMSETDFSKLSKDGFDHVRLPVDEAVLWNEDGRKNEKAFNFLHKGIRWALKNELRVIVDLHIIRSHYFNAGQEGKVNKLWTDETEQSHFLDLWGELSDELKQYPVSMLAYEIMNEPTAPDHEDWNGLVAKACRYIRKREPDRMLVIGSNMWQGVGTFPFLKVPEGDKHIMLSFHFYEPFLLTHYRAGWTDLANFGGNVHYPGMLVSKEEMAGLAEADRKLASRWPDEWSKAKLVSLVEKAKKIADAKGLILYCGEFGVYQTAPRADALRWYSDIVSVFGEMDIPWSVWDYKGGYGIYSPDGVPRKELIRILVPMDGKK